MPAAPEIRPLVMRCGAFGDIVLVTALLRQLQLRFGRPVDVIASGPWSKPLLAGRSDVADIFIVGSRKTPFWLSRRQRALVRWLRARGAGPTWFADPGPAGRNLLRRGGIPDSYVLEDAARPVIAGEHVIDRWIHFANLTPPAFEGKLPETTGRVERAAVLEIAATANDALQAWLHARSLTDRELILIQAGNKRTMRRGSWTRSTNTKYWPSERWAEVIRGLRAAKPAHAIVLLGVPSEYALNAVIARVANVPDVHNVADDLPLDVLLPLLARASSMVSVDTGPAHAAAALGCPTVALFGASDPQFYRPGGPTTPAIALTGEIDGKQTMLGIEAHSVLRAWQRLNAR